MSGHSKWSRVKRFKGAIDAKRGNLFSNRKRFVRPSHCAHRASCSANFLALFGPGVPVIARDFFFKKMKK
jgi:hypothetical protein